MSASQNPWHAATSSCSTCSIANARPRTGPEVRARSRPSRLGPGYLHAAKRGAHFRALSCHNGEWLAGDDSGLAVRLARIIRPNCAVPLQPAVLHRPLLQGPSRTVSPRRFIASSHQPRIELRSRIPFRSACKLPLYDITCSPCVCQPQYRIIVSHHPCAILALGVAKIKYALLAATRVPSRRQYTMYNRIHVCPYNPITTSARQSGNLCACPLNCLLHLPPKISNIRTACMGTVSSTIYKSILVPTSLCFACMKLPAIRWKNRILFKLANTFRLSLEKCFILAPPIFDISQLLTGSPGQHVPIRGKRNTCQRLPLV